MTILELDTFLREGMQEPVTTYVVLSMEEIPLQEIPQIENLRNIHSDMISAYKKADFKLCLDILPHLKGKWAGNVDSFYDIFEKRIENLDNKLDENWDGILRNHQGEL
jgi:hypothetical protein